MYHRFIVFCFVVLLLVCGAFAQCDSLRMTLVGSWECPTNDLAHFSASIGKIGNYVFLGAAWETWTPYDYDTLWVIDVTTAESCSTIMIYTDTAFASEPAKIRWFTVNELCNDSGYVYIEYYGGGRNYFRVLKFKHNPLGFTRMGILDSVGFDHLQIFNINNWVYGGFGFIRVANPSSPLKVEPTRYVEGYRYPPDGSSADRSMGDRSASGGYSAISGGIRSDSSILSAAYFTLYEVCHPVADVETIRTIGCWRGDYEDDGATAVAINETLEIVALGTGFGKIHFVDIDDVIDSNYSADPIATHNIGEPITDLYWIDNYLYIAAYNPYVLDVSDLDAIDTVAMYNLYGLIGSTAWNIFSFENYVYVRAAGLLYILEVDTSMQVGDDSCSFLDEEFRIFPNPIMQNSRIILSKKLNKPKLYNLAGKRMSLNDRTIDTSLLSPGIYFLSAEYNKKRITKKITVVN